uniref:Uncharacterized protein n=1 Tax=Chlamydomonas euryale TaxID=1486919 RepID=A0A7R9VLQ6_9CHLO|mmetsp:Transcript_39275/g.116853  ORF Transcript_39275/g.116853 Transcript_39275/m.116853 type:complete len:348 (+) Transcript_39275:209-1252(+)
MPRPRRVEATKAAAAPVVVTMLTPPPPPLRRAAAAAAAAVPARRSQAALQQRDSSSSFEQLRPPPPPPQMQPPQEEEEEWFACAAAAALPPPNTSSQGWSAQTLRKRTPAVPITQRAGNVASPARHASGHPLSGSSLGDVPLSLLSSALEAYGSEDALMAAVAAASASVERSAPHHRNVPSTWSAPGRAAVINNLTRETTVSSNLSIVQAMAGTRTGSSVTQLEDVLMGMSAAPAATAQPPQVGGRERTNVVRWAKTVDSQSSLDDGPRTSAAATQPAGRPGPQAFRHQVTATDMTPPGGSGLHSLGGSGLHSSGSSAGFNHTPATLRLQQALMLYTQIGGDVLDRA